VTRPYLMAHRRGERDAGAIVLFAVKAALGVAMVLALLVGFLLFGPR
jgi:hypothetical protein